MKNSESKKSISLKDIFYGLFFSGDGRCMVLSNGCGEVVMRSVVFLICCGPIVTIGPAVTSLYYAVIKSVRRGRGTPLGEFFSSMKRTLGKGIIVTLEIMAIGAALYIGYRQAVAMNEAATAGISDHDGKVFATVYVILGVLLAAISVYIFPILSRFSSHSGDGGTCVVTDICFSDTVCCVCSGVLVFHCDIYDGEGIVALYA